MDLPTPALAEAPGLVDLALDLRWTWSHEGDRLWNTIDPEFWERAQNPWLMLQVVPNARIRALMADPAFQGELQYLLESRREYLAAPGWFRDRHPQQALNPVAYFSMEFGLGEALPVYAGGLGILAGDYLKTASDLHVPVVGVGILYQEGYFRQLIDPNGWQVEAFPYNDSTALPIRPVTDGGGGRLRVSLELPGRTLRLRVWQAQVGNTTLYLLDSNDPLNNPADRGITNKLYDDRPEIRLMQEMILGIGGWRLLSALGIPVEVCHLNEGHPAFVVLERARALAAVTNRPFAVALAATRAGNIFTTHTPVSAGFDAFPPYLISQYLHDYLRTCGITVTECLTLGQKDGANPDEPFNMAYLAARGSGTVNGVSRLHEKVSQRLFQPLFERWPQHEVPVGHITNGVHVPSWDSQYTDDLWTKACGKERWLHAVENLSDEIQRLADAELWAFRSNQSRNLVKFVRQRLAYQLRRRGAAEPEVAAAGQVLDPNALILGFARRFTSYKRPNLLLSDTMRLERIINNKDRPLQIVAAGKAHPEDLEGKRLVQQFVNFANRPSVAGRVIFIEDYDISIAQELVQGVDLWLNTPRRPWEACGTSGMKVLVNGGLNVSELDGWWAEAYEPEVGWAIGDGKEHTESTWDTVEAQQLYNLLENEVVPLFYQRNEEGIPAGWLARMRLSMAKLAPRFSSNRMLRDYVETSYIPATERYRQRVADGARLAAETLAWQSALAEKWTDLRFLDVKTEAGDGRLSFTASVRLGRLDPAFVRVEAYVEPLDSQPIEPVPMEPGETADEKENVRMYRASIATTRPAADFTLRIVPVNPVLSIPLEEDHILWQR